MYVYGAQGSTAAQAADARASGRRYRSTCPLLPGALRAPPQQEMNPRDQENPTYLGARRRETARV